MIESNFVFSEISIAKNITDRIYLNSEIKRHRINNVEFLWGSYSELYQKFSLNKARNSKLHKLNRFHFTIFKYFPIYFIAIIYSIFSIFILFTTCTFRKKIAIWTGDFYNSDLKSDFRLGNFYKELEKNNIKYIEFIRLGEISYKTFFLNLYRRKRLAVYYDSFDLIFFFLTPALKIKLKDNYFNKQDLVFINNYLKYFSKKRYQIYFFSLIFNLFKIKNYIIWETSHRQFYSRIAAYKCNVNTIGFMHGFTFNSYMSYMHLEKYNGEFKFGPDIFVVWSKFWKNYFSQSKIYNTIYDWGTLRFNTFSKSLLKNTNKRLEILYITEPLIEISETINYLEYIISNNDIYHLTFKLRNLNCKFYNKLINKYPVFKKVKIIIDPFEKAVFNFDVVIGTHSTAVLESSIFCIPFLVIRTKKWGDYFEISKSFPQFLVSNLNEFNEKLLNINKVDDESLKFFSENYFGKKNSINKILNLLK